MLGAGDSEKPVPLVSVLKRFTAQLERYEDTGGSRLHKKVSRVAQEQKVVVPPLLALTPMADATDRS